MSHRFPINDLLSAHFAAAIEYVEEEIRNLNDTANRLEKAARDRIINTYPDETDRWRALASDSFIRLADTLVVLREGQRDMSDPQQPCLVVPA